MKLIGIVGRAYYNKDNQHVFQVNEALRSVLVGYEDVSVISLLPTNKSDYLSLEMGFDKIEEVDKKKLDFILAKCDAFVVPGGTYWYNFDEYVIRCAIKYDKPLLAICAGFQALCSMYATKRNKFDMTKKFSDRLHYGECDGYSHKNFVEKNSKLEEIIGENCFWVNSVHHDYIDFDMNELIVSCYSDDGVIEGVELPGKCFVMGIQWHPEYLMDKFSMKIFDGFVKSIRKKMLE